MAGGCNVASAMATLAADQRQEDSVVTAILGLCLLCVVGQQLADSFYIGFAVVNNSLYLREERFGGQDGCCCRCWSYRCSSRSARLNQNVSACPIFWFARSSGFS